MEAMIAAHQQSDSLLDTDAISGETVVEERPAVPRQIGDFEILRNLAAAAWAWFTKPDRNR